MRQIPRIPLRPFLLISLVVSVFAGPLQGQTLKRVEESDFGKARDGSDVKLVTLRNARGMSVEIITYGSPRTRAQTPSTGEGKDSRSRCGRLPARPPPPTGPR